MLDIDLIINFRSPYFSSTFKEFWNRWHISLSTWFRDYVYIPLGGNRVSKIRHRLNLFVTFMISGLWHGANWTFLVWGGCHGTFQVIENIFSDKLKRLQKNKCGKVLSVIIIFFMCNILWIFFRAETISKAFYFIKRIFCDWENLLVFSKEQLNLSEKTLMVVYFDICVMAVFDFCSLKKDVILWISEQNAVLRWCVYLLLVWLIVLGMPIANSEFVYFQF